MRTCEIAGCDRKHNAKGLCLAHYKRMRKGADLLAPFKNEWSLQERFWDQVDKTESCWEWRTGLTHAGYGQIRDQGRNCLAHRLSWSWSNGPIPPGMQIDHVCRNRACVRPSHLRSVTDGQNKQNLGGDRKNNKSGIRGVSWYSRDKKWTAQAGIGGGVRYLGRYDSIEQAEAVVTAWRRENMPYSIMDQRPTADRDEEILI